MDGFEFLDEVFGQFNVDVKKLGLFDESGEGLSGVVMYNDSVVGGLVLEMPVPIRSVEAGRFAYDLSRQDIESIVEKFNDGSKSLFPIMEPDLIFLRNKEDVFVKEWSVVLAALKPLQDPHAFFVTDGVTQISFPYTTVWTRHFPELPGFQVPICYKNGSDIGLYFGTNSVKDFDPFKKVHSSSVILDSVKKHKLGIADYIDSFKEKISEYPTYPLFK